MFNLIQLFLMAIQAGAITFRGKLGNVVGFNLPNAAKAGSMGARIYQSSVSNPKTEAQAIQRMKMTAAVNFYRSLVDILNNAWQGQKYGTKSRYYFMKLALSQAEGLPFIEKGDKHFYPGEFPVAQGSLPTQSVTSISNGLAVPSFSAGEYESSGGSGTWGDASQALINNTFGLLDGDKITFIGVGVRNGEYMPIYSYVILNTSSEQTIAEVAAGSNINLVIAGPLVQFGFTQFDTLAAAAVIVSRYPQSGAGSWLRSSAAMYVDPTYRELLMGTDAYNNALPTYLNASASLSSDWYLNRGVTGSGTDVDWAGGGSNVSIISSSIVNITISGSSHTAVLLTMSDGSKRAAKTDSDALVTGGDLATGFVTDGSVSVTTNILNIIKAVDSTVTSWQVVEAELENRP